MKILIAAALVAFSMPAYGQATSADAFAKTVAISRHV
jgi:hypothetical protein